MKRNTTRRLLFNVVALVMAFSSASSVQAVQSFKGDAPICISPSLSCSASTSVWLPGGALRAEIRHRGFDNGNFSFDYVGEFTNNSRCRITIGSTLLRHGESNMAVQTLDWGLIQLDPGQSVRSQSVRTFRMSREQSERLQFVRLTFSGLANCD